jgi:hypothetical protein
MVDKAKPDAVAARPAVSSRTKRALMYTGLGVAALGAAYGGGRLQTQGDVDKAEEQTRERAAAEAEQVKLREQAHARVRELEGRRQLALALVALDERNFGTAQGHLAKAGAMFAESKGDAGLEELARNAGSYKLVATDDIGTQRKLLMDWTRKFDALRPPPQ